MNGDRAMAYNLCTAIRDGAGIAGNAEIAVCPPHLLIAAAAEALGDSAVSLGAQDLDANESGAFTGQTSAAMLVDGGCKYVIIGHSERRALYGESDALTAQKTRAALAAGLRPILCVGETLSERESGKTFDVVGRQLDTVLNEVGDAFADGVIAYEPVWAIGTGKTATPEQAQAVHRFIRDTLADNGVSACRILYGGSMKPDNAGALIAEADIDGGLIGGAALNATDFLAICEAAGSA